MFIVVIGTIEDGHSFIGPFQSWEEAEAWADQSDEITWVVELKNPKDQTDG